MTTFDLLAQAAGHHRAGRLDEAETLYRLLLRSQPQTPDALRLLGLIVRRRDRAAAETLTRRSLTLDPASGEGFGSLGLLLHEKGCFDEAEAVLRRALLIRRDNAEVLATLGAVHQARGVLHLAEAAFRAALFCRPDHIEALFGAARVALDRDAPEEAAVRLRGVLVLEPGLPVVLYNLALALQLEGSLEEATRIYRRLLSVEPGHAKGLTMLARLRLLAGAVDEAEDALRKAQGLGFEEGEVAEGLYRCARYRAASAAAADERLPPGLVVRGPFRDTSGYAWMVRRFVRTMVEQAVRVNLIDLRVGFVPALEASQRDPLLEGLDRPVRARSMLTFAIPSVAERAPGLRPVNFSMFEARTVPRQWLLYAATLPQIIVPTESSRLAWVDAGFPEERLHLCPLGVDPPPGEDVAPLQLADSQGRRLADYSTRILNVSDLVDRKNLDGLLRVWFRVSRPDQGAALVLKLGKGSAERDRKAAPFIEKVARSVGRRLDETGPIFLVQGVLGDDAMVRLFAACSHYWSMSHGEGWDLPMTQAGSMGLRLIAPRHSAYTAYLDEEVATLIPAAPGPALPPYQGLDWWNPDEDAAADALVRAIAGRDAPRRAARDKLMEEFGWARATSRLLTILRETGAL